MMKGREESWESGRTLLSIEHIIVIFTQDLCSSESVLNSLRSCRGSKLEVLSYCATTEAPGVLRIRFGLDILNTFSVAGMDSEQLS
jgi:hypothetical protein